MSNSQQQKITGVWYLESPRNLLSSVTKLVAFDDRGDLLVHGDRVEFHGKKTNLVIHHVKSISQGRLGTDPVNSWLKVEYGEASVAHFKSGEKLGWGQFRGGNDQLQAAFEPLVRTTQGAAHATMELDIQFLREERVPIATEDVTTPTGVKVRIKRSRGVERALELRSTSSTNSRLEVGLEQIVKGSIMHQIETETGQSFKQTETTEYEIELDGTAASRYRLTWTEVWIEGLVKHVEDGRPLEANFRLRDRAELAVQPLPDG